MSKLGFLFPASTEIVDKYEVAIKIYTSISCSNSNYVQFLFNCGDLRITRDIDEINSVIEIK